MPGSPKTSLSAALLYDTILTPGYDLGLSLNGVYRSSVPMQLAPTLGAVTVQQSSSYEILNFSAAVSHQSWRVYVLHHQSVGQAGDPGAAGPAGADNDFNMLANDYVVNPPREIGRAGGLQVLGAPRVSGVGDSVRSRFRRQRTASGTSCPNMIASPRSPSGLCRNTWPKFAKRPTSAGVSRCHWARVR